MASATKTQKQTASTKKATAKKATAKKAAAPATKKAASKKEDAVVKEPGKIASIIEHHKKGLSNQEIVDLGFNKTTVSINVAKYKKEKAAEKEARKAAKQEG